MRHGRSSYDLAQDQALKSLRFYRIEPVMQLGVAYWLLYRTLQRIRTDVVATPEFMDDVEMFIRRMIEYDTPLKNEIYDEIRQWNRENVGTGKSFPKSFLFPRSTAPFELMRAQAEEGLQAVIDREQRMEEQLQKRKEAAKKREERVKKAIKK